MAKDALKAFFNNRPRDGRLCPFLKRPFDDCLCMDMDSQKTFGALYYCRTNFQECEIYQKHHAAMDDVADKSEDGADE